MFNWLGNLFPYSDLHSLNLDWILNKMKETAAQAAKAVADAANALAQVAEAKAAALSAQTAAEDAQTAANKAAGNAASAAANAVQALNAAQTAQNAAETAQNTANTAQSTAETAQSAAQTAQSAAENAQSKADTAYDRTITLNNRFPVREADIADKAVTATKIQDKGVSLINLTTTTSYLYQNETGNNSARFPRSGSATFEQITTGIVDAYANRLSHLKSNYLQIGMDITEENIGTPNTVFTCISPVVKYIKKDSAGLTAIAPIIVIKNDNNDIYNGFIRLSQDADGINLYIKCEVIFKTNPPFNNNTTFVITANPVSAQLAEHI